MDMKNELLKEDLHKLLDKMIDENLVIGVLQKAFVDENLEIQYLNYVLTLKKEESNVWRYE